MIKSKPIRFSQYINGKNGEYVYLMADGSFKYDPNAEKWNTESVNVSLYKRIGDGAPQLFTNSGYFYTITFNDKEQGDPQGYPLEWPDNGKMAVQPTQSKINPEGKEEKEIAAKPIVVTLYNNKDKTTLIDIEVIGVTYDGKTGEDAVYHYLTLTNDSDTIAIKNGGTAISTNNFITKTSVFAFENTVSQELTTSGTVDIPQPNLSITPPSGWKEYDSSTEEGRKGHYSYQDKENGSVELIIHAVPEVSDGQKYIFTFTWQEEKGTETSISVSKDFTILIKKSDADYDLYIPKTVFNLSVETFSLTPEVHKRADASVENIFGPNDNIKIYASKALSEGQLEINGRGYEWPSDNNTKKWVAVSEITESFEISLYVGDSKWDAETIEFVKDGDAAVAYELLLSPSVISPSATAQTITITPKKITGTNHEDITSSIIQQGDYLIIEKGKTTPYIPTDGAIKHILAANSTDNVTFQLWLRDKNGQHTILLAENTLAVVADGVEAVSYGLDMSNDLEIVAKQGTTYFGAGEITINNSKTTYYATTTFTAYKNGVQQKLEKDETSANFTTSSSSGIYMVESGNSIIVYITEAPDINGEDYSFTWQYGTSNEKITKIFKVRAIESDVDYELVPTISSFNKSNGNATVSFSVKKRGANGVNEIKNEADGDKEGLAIYKNSETSKLSSWSIELEDTTSFTLKKDNVVWDTETIQAVSNGSAYTLDLSNDFEIVTQTSSGTWLGTSTKNGKTVYAETIFSAYENGEEYTLTLNESGKSGNFSISNTGLTEGVDYDLEKNGNKITLYIYEEPTSDGKKYQGCVNINGTILVKDFTVKKVISQVDYSLIITPNSYNEEDVATEEGRLVVVNVKKISEGGSTIITTWDDLESEDANLGFTIDGEIYSKSYRQGNLEDYIREGSTSNFEVELVTLKVDETTETEEVIYVWDQETITYAKTGLRGPSTVIYEAKPDAEQLHRKSADASDLTDNSVTFTFYKTIEAVKTEYSLTGQYSVYTDTVADNNKIANATLTNQTNVTIGSLLGGKNVEGQFVPYSKLIFKFEEGTESSGYTPFDDVVIEIVDDTENAFVMYYYEETGENVTGGDIDDAPDAPDANISYYSDYYIDEEETTYWSKQYNDVAIWKIEKLCTFAAYDTTEWNGPIRIKAKDGNDAVVDIDYQDLYDALDKLSADQEANSGIYAVDGHIAVNADLIKTGAIKVGNSLVPSENKFYADMNNGSAIYLAGWEVGKEFIKKDDTLIYSGEDKTCTSLISNTSTPIRFSAGLTVDQKTYPRNDYTEEEIIISNFKIDLIAQKDSDINSNYELIKIEFDNNGCVNDVEDQSISFSLSPENYKVTITGQYTYNLELINMDSSFEGTGRLIFNARFIFGKIGGNRSFMVLEDGSLFASAIKVTNGTLGYENSIFLSSQGDKLGNDTVNGINAKWMLRIGQNFAVSTKGLVNCNDLRASAGEIAGWTFDSAKFYKASTKSSTKPIVWQQDGIGMSNKTEPNVVFWSGFKGITATKDGKDYTYFETPSQVYDFYNKNPSGYGPTGATKDSWKENTTFYVTREGEVNCKNLIATGGEIGGWQLLPDGLYNLTNNLSITPNGITFGDLLLSQDGKIQSIKNDAALYLDNQGRANTYFLFEWASPRDDNVNSYGQNIVINIYPCKQDGTKITATDNYSAQVYIGYRNGYQFGGSKIDQWAYYLSFYISKGRSSCSVTIPADGNKRPVGNYFQRWAIASTAELAKERAEKNSTNYELKETIRSWKTFYGNGKVPVFRMEGNLLPYGNQNLGSELSPWLDAYITNAYITNAYITNQYKLDAKSDARVKNSISSLPQSYEIFFDNMLPSRYKYNEGTSNRYHTGFIAQQLVAALEISGLTTQDFAGVVLNNPGTENECWYLRRDEFVALNTWQIQKLKPRMTSAEEKLVAYESRISALEREIENLKNS